MVSCGLGWLKSTPSCSAICRWLTVGRWTDSMVRAPMSCYCQKGCSLAQPVGEATPPQVSQASSRHCCKQLHAPSAEPLHTISHVNFRFSRATCLELRLQVGINVLRHKTRVSSARLETSWPSTSNSDKARSSPFFSSSPWRVNLCLFLDRPVQGRPSACGLEIGTWHKSCER